MSVDLTKYEILDTLCLPFAKRDRIEDIDPRIRGKGGDLSFKQEKD